MRGPRVSSAHESLHAGGSCDGRYQELFHAGAASQRGVTMRDCSKNRAGFDRVLMAVAATFLTVSASSVLAQADPARSAAELAIDAAIPRPEPANLPPPTINDFKLDTTATVPDAAKTRPSDIVTAPAADTRKNDTATTTPAPPPAAAPTTPSAQPAPAPTPAASSLPPAEQPCADNLRETLRTKSCRHFVRKAENDAVMKCEATRESD